MALDTKYRPLRFEDVVGQEGTVKVLQRFVHTNTGFHQSYLFCGGHGSGKTTLARILARALLCEAPQDGNPCDQCGSCLSILNHGSSDCFVEVDAASNSGKEDMRKIIEQLQYDTFSGRQRIYLFDEAHRLSRDALDALLKPMEDTVGSSEDKQLVCIFCTTEPEKMRATIFSRCAPAFVIRMVPPEIIAKRLAYVCEQEHIGYEQDALVCIAEAAESHIRDALKSVEGVSMLGDITLKQVKTYLRLNVNDIYVKILIWLAKDLNKTLTYISELKEIVSPSTAYDQLAELTMLAYRIGIGVGKAPSFWEPRYLKGIYQEHQHYLVQIAKTLAMKPGHPTYAMLECDLASLFHLKHSGNSAGGVATPSPVKSEAPVIAEIPAVNVNTEAKQEISLTTREEVKPEPSEAGIMSRVTPALPIVPPRPVVTRSGVYVDPRGIRKKDASESYSFSEIPPLDVSEFKRGLLRLVAELTADGRHRPTG